MASAGMQSRVTPFEHTMIGGMGGTMEVFIMQPMMALKNALQEGRPIPTRPRELYRGLLVSGAPHAAPCSPAHSPFVPAALV